MHTCCGCRHRSLALCCRRWHRLVCGPELLRSVTVRIPETLAFMPRFRSMCGWLVRRAAPHMAQLRLELHAHLGMPWGAQWGGNDDWQPWWLDFTALLASTLAACGTHGRLAELCLELDAHYKLHLGSWLAPLASLRRLSVTLGDGVVVVSSPLRCLTALQHLSLDAFPSSFDSSVAWEAEAEAAGSGGPLPASLTSLCLSRGGDFDVLPPQVSTLVGRCRPCSDAAARRPRTACLPRMRLPACLPTLAARLHPTRLSTPAGRPAHQPAAAGAAECAGRGGRRFRLASGAAAQPHHSAPGRLRLSPAQLPRPHVAAALAARVPAAS